MMGSMWAVTEESLRDIVQMQELEKEEDSQLDKSVRLRTATSTGARSLDEQQEEMKKKN